MFVKISQETETFCDSIYFRLMKGEGKIYLWK